MDEQHPTRDREAEALRDMAARREMLRRDGRRDPGENLEQAAALIQAAFELRDSLSTTGR